MGIALENGRQKYYQGKREETFFELDFFHVT